MYLFRKMMPIDERIFAAHPEITRMCSAKAVDVDMDEYFFDGEDSGGSSFTLNRKTDGVKSRMEHRHWRVKQIMQAI